jgi:hypothetical protein
MDNYTIAWLMYLAGSLGALLVLLRITSRLRSTWRYPLLATAAALLLTPARIDPEQGFWAPAILILTLDSLFEANAELAQAGLLLLMGWLVAVLIALGLLFFERR